MMHGPGGGLEVGVDSRDQVCTAQCSSHMSLLSP